MGGGKLKVMLTILHKIFAEGHEITNDGYFCSNHKNNSSYNLSNSPLINYVP
jgi:hypothetical protein